MSPVRVFRGDRTSGNAGSDNSLGALIGDAWEGSPLITSASAAPSSAAPSYRSCGDFISRRRMMAPMRGSAESVTEAGSGGASCNTC
jgi:hypothetical protein